MVKTVMKLSNNISNIKLIDFYFSVVVFNAINREFRPFGIDLRYILFLAGIILIIKKYNNILPTFKKSDKITRRVIELILYALITLIFTYITNTKTNAETFNLLILYSYNLIIIIVFVLYRKNINKYTIVNSILFSVIILSISMFSVLIFKKLSNVFGGRYGGYVPQRNFLGFNMRIGGYAEDPNYSSFFLVASIALLYLSDFKKIYKMAMILLLIPFFLLSASKTILVGIIVTILYVLIRSYLFKRNRSFWIYSFNFLFVFILPVIIILFVKLNGFRFFPFLNPSTMSARYHMWNYAIRLFQDRPIFGAGLGQFRIFYEQIGYWYVQAHSSLFQVISELGIVGTTLYLLIFWHGLKDHSLLRNLIIMLFFIFGLTSELLYQSFFPVFVLFLIPIEKRETKKVLKPTSVFFTNSLKGGGAEKVVEVLATNSAMTNDTIVISFENSNDTLYNFNTIIYDIPNKNNVKRFIKMIFGLIYINYLYFRLSYYHSFNCVTSHLPMSQLIVKLSDFNKYNINVVHGSIHLFPVRIKRIVAHILYMNEDIFYLTDDFPKELEEICIQPKSLKKIRNPYSLSLEQVGNQVKRMNIITFIGRLVEIKNPYLAIQAFMNSKSFNNHQLYILGDGDLYQDIQKYIFDNNLLDKIKLYGFVSNPLEIISKSNKVIMTSDSEVFPMIAIESLMLDVPLISTNSGAWVHEVLSPKNVVYEKEPQLQIKILSELIDFNHLELKGYGFISDKEKFLPSVVMADYRALYHEVKISS